MEPKKVLSLVILAFGGGVCLANFSFWDNYRLFVAIFGLVVAIIGLTISLTNKK